MHTVNQYKDILLKHFYLDENDEIRRKLDGYLGRFNKGDLAKFHKNATGYNLIQVPDGVRRGVFKHHLIYLLKIGELPDNMEIDHIDGNKDNNTISNLRVVDRRLNNRNRKKRSDNTSGVTGINWSSYHNHYVIRKVIGNKRISKSRKTFKEALIALKELEKLDISYTERHGK